MAIITVSRGSFSRGSEVAIRLADALGFEYVAREVLLEASEQFNIPEIRLVRAIKNSPSILDRITSGRKRYISFIQAAVLNRLRRDNVVYNGLAGHFFVRDISHVVKIRVLADQTARLNIVKARDGVSPEQALATLRHDDAERRKWGQHLYGIDTNDPCLYDLVVQINRVTVDDAVDMIRELVKGEQFQTTEESQREIDDLAIAANVQATLMTLTPDVQVSANQGDVVVRTLKGLTQVNAATRSLQDLAKTVPGVGRVDIIPGLLTNTKEASAQL